MFLDNIEAMKDRWGNFRTSLKLNSIFPWVDILSSSPTFHCKITSEWVNVVSVFPQTLYKTQVKELKEEIEERNRQVQEAHKKMQELSSERWVWNLEKHQRVDAGLNSNLSKWGFFLCWMQGLAICPAGSDRDQSRIGAARPSSSGGAVLWAQPGE